MPIFSVIIPVYNVEKYLPKCLDSVIGNTFKNIEIICVNDASTDNSTKILEEYARKDSRIKLLNNSQNMGIATTRNNGLKVATGEYIHFVDSDDYIELNIYQKVFDIISKDKFDIIQFGYATIKNNNKLDERFPVKINAPMGVIKPSEHPEYFKNAFAVWSKIYNKEFLDKNNIQFENVRCYEDIPFFIETSIKAERLCTLNEIFYNYIISRSGSLYNSFIKYFDLYFTHYANIKSLLKDADKNIQRIISKKVILDICYAYEQISTKNIFLLLKYWKKVKKLALEECCLESDDSTYLKDFINIFQKDRKCYFLLKISLKRFCPTLFHIILKIKNNKNMHKESN